MASGAAEAFELRLIDGDAEARPIQRQHRAILDREGFGQHIILIVMAADAMGVTTGGRADGNDAGQRNTERRQGEMHIGRIADRRFDRAVDVAGPVGGFSEGRDLAGTHEAAGFREVDRDAIGALSTIEIERVVQIPAGLIGDDGNGGAARDLGHLPQAHRRLLHIIRTGIGQLPDDADGGLGLAISLVGVETQTDAVLQFAPQDADEPDVPRGIDAALDLQGGDAVRHGTKRLVDRFRLRHQAHHMGDRNARAARAPEQLVEKLAHQNRERIPERTVHAKGSGAFGTFTLSRDLSQYTKARIFTEVGQKTDLLLRFSTVAGERGAADAERDVRGFALKFYTKDGNWDLVGNNTPVFFVRDPMKFPDFIHTQKRHPRSNMRSPTAMWDFWSLSPESLHQVTILFSDRGLPRSYRHVNGYGSHTFSFWNDAGERYWVKFHFKTQQGHEYMTNDQGNALIATDRESSQRDLYDSIEHGDFPKWKVQVQIMPEADAEKTAYNPFDLTKVWPHADYPCIDIGMMELNRNPENYFAEIEQSSFSPSNVVPGIAFSPDKMLQARIFSYADAHRYRVGTHYEMLPVNRPQAKVTTYHLDGSMRFDAPRGPDAYYEPNSFNGPVEVVSAKEPPLRISGDAERYNHRVGNDDYSQPRALFNLFDAQQKDRLCGNIAASMGGVPDFVTDRAIGEFTKVDPAYGEGVRRALEKSRVDTANSAPPSAGTRIAAE